MRFRGSKMETQLVSFPSWLDCRNPCPLQIPNLPGPLVSVSVSSSVTGDTETDSGNRIPWKIFETMSQSQTTIPKALRRAETPHRVLPGLSLGLPGAGLAGGSGAITRGRPENLQVVQ